MNPIKSFLIRTIFPGWAVAIIWPISYFAFDQTLLYTSLFSIMGGLLTYSIASRIVKIKYLKKYGLTNREFIYIKRNLGEANRKIKRLSKAQFSIRKISFFRQSREIQKLTKQIYKLTKKEPKRFYQAESFYFSHLDSVVELTERYIFLSSQPKNNPEISQSLKETRLTLNELTQALEQDLEQVLADDVDSLQYELDVAKHSLKIMDQTRADKWKTK